MNPHPNNNAITEAFRAAGLSIKRLADESRVPDASVHGLLAGDRDASLGTAARLGKVLRLRLVPDMATRARKPPKAGR